MVQMMNDVMYVASGSVDYEILAICSGCPEVQLFGDICGHQNYKWYALFGSVALPNIKVPPELTYWRYHITIRYYAYSHWTWKVVKVQFDCL